MIVASSAVRTAILACALLTGQSSLAASGDWESEYEQGVAAADQGEHKVAVEHLAAACDLASAAADSNAQAKACLRLATVHAVDTDFKKSRVTIEELLKRLETLPNVRPNDVVDALLLLADIQGALGESGDATESIRKALDYQNEITTLEKAAMLLQMAELYLPFKGNKTGAGLLGHAQTALAGAVDYADPLYVRTATRFAWALTLADRKDEAQQVVARLLQEGDKLFAADARPATELGESYIEAANHAGVLAIPKGASKEEKEAAAAKGDEWRRRLSGPPGVLRVNEGDVSAPTLRLKRDPVYTAGAKAMGVKGRVLLYVEVWPDGKAHNIRIVRPLPYGLAWASMGAVYRWRFEPGRMDGLPVKVAATVEVNFELR